MATVQGWDPAQNALTKRHYEIISTAISQLDSTTVELSEDEQALLRPTMNLAANDWREFVRHVETPELVNWIKVMTLIERDIQGFDVGAKSPVLALIGVLRNRNAVPAGLFKWIRANTANRFLPYGSLADRL